MQIIEADNISLGEKEELIPNLGNKTKYKLHCQNLKLWFKVRTTVKKFIEWYD